MKKKLFLLPAACLLLGACEMDRSETSTKEKVKHREQVENETDRSMTQRIRQSLLDDDTLSTNAQNIKIITLNGVVTLRGPVNSEREKNEIERKIKVIMGVKNVDNQLDVIAVELLPAPSQKVNRPQANK